jgi:hypothetical protein
MLRWGRTGPWYASIRPVTVAVRLDYVTSDGSCFLGFCNLLGGFASTPRESANYCVINRHMCSQSGVAGYRIPIDKSRSLTQSWSNWMKRRCMGSWCPHLPTAGRYGARDQVVGHQPGWRRFLRENDSVALLSFAASPVTRSCTGTNCSTKISVRQSRADRRCYREHGAEACFVLRRVRPLVIQRRRVQ